MSFLSTCSTAFPNFSLNVEVVWCFIEQDNEILVLEKSTPEGGFFKWGVPGGKIQPGVDISPCAGMLREVLEETGIWLGSSACDLIAQRYARFKQWDYRLFIFRTKLLLRPPVSLSKEHIAFQWIPINHFTGLTLLKGQTEAFQLVYPTDFLNSLLAK
jgi:8-oxo-dGTP pyrophosphatase MutT (NUDIX family)